MTTLRIAPVGAVIILSLLAGYFIVRMNSAETVIDVLKYGFGLVCATIHLMGAMYGGRNR